MKYPRFMTVINKIAGLIAGSFVFIIASMQAFEVVMRGFFDKPTTWSMDISAYLFIWSLFLGTSYSLQEKGHVAVESFREYLKKNERHGLSRFLTVAGYLISTSVIGVLLWSGCRIVQLDIARNRLTATFIQIPRAYLTSAIVAGAALMLVTVLGILADLLGGGEEYL